MTFFEMLGFSRFLRALVTSHKSFNDIFLLARAHSYHLTNSQPQQADVTNERRRTSGIRLRIGVSAEGGREGGRAYSWKFTNVLGMRSEKNFNDLARKDGIIEHRTKDFRESLSYQL